MAILQFQNGPVVAATSEPIPLDIEQVGPRGPKGWTPVIVGVRDGGRKVLLLADWTGGANPKPATGYIGPEGLVADIANAVDFAGRGLISVTQDQNANLVINYNDNSTDIIPAYFAPMLVAAAEVDADAQAVELSRQAVVNIQADVVTRQSQINDTKVANDATKVAIDAKAAEVESNKVQVNGLLTQATEIVHNGSTDWPTLVPDFYWHCEEGELHPLMEPSWSSGSTNPLVIMDHRGQWTPVYANSRAVEYNEQGWCKGAPLWEGSENKVRNNLMVGAVLGTLLPGNAGTGRAPDNWSYLVDPSSGLSMSLVGTGKEQGLNYIDIRVFGTASTSYSPLLYFDGNGSNPVMTQGQTWTGSAFFKLIAGSFAGFASFNFQIDERNSAGTYLNGAAVNIADMPSDKLKRYFITRTMADATSAKGNIRLSSQVLAGNTVDVTVRIAGPQLELRPWPTPFMPNFGAVSSTATRGSIINLVQGLAMQQINGLTEGTLVCEYYTENNTHNGGSSNPAVLSLELSSSIYANRTQIRRISTSGGIYVNLIENNIGRHSASDANGSIIRRRAAYSFKSGYCVAAAEGVAFGESSATFPFPAMDRMRMNAETNGWIREVAYYRKALTKSQIVALSRI